jgi:hypothetical protein
MEMAHSINAETFQRELLQILIKQSQITSNSKGFCMFSQYFEGV